MQCIWQTQPCLFCSVETTFIWFHHITNSFMKFGNLVSHLIQFLLDRSVDYMCHFWFDRHIALDCVTFEYFIYYNNYWNTLKFMWFYMNNKIINFINLSKCKALDLLGTFIYLFCKNYWNTCDNMNMFIKNNFNINAHSYNCNFFKYKFFITIFVYTNNLNKEKSMWEDLSSAQYLLGKYKVTM